MSSGDYSDINKEESLNANSSSEPINSDITVYREGTPTITRTIGRGEDAKNSVIWHVIFTTFCIFSCIVSSLLIIDLYRTKGSGSLRIVKEIWSIFTPILTLSLGYMFGSESVVKNKQSNK